MKNVEFTISELHEVNVNKYTKKGEVSMVFDYSELSGRITAKFKTKKRYAKAAEMPASSLSMKLNNKTPWTSPEIYTAIQLLDIPPEKLSEYFFTPKVHNM